MHIDDLLADHAGVLERNAGVRLLGRHRFDNEVKSGGLVAVFPRTYARPWDIDDVAVRLRAAVLSVGGEVALSHVTALALRGLPAGDDARVHVTAYNPRHPRGVVGQLVVHRTRLPLDAGLVDGLPAVSCEAAVLNSWPLLTGADQRAPLLEAHRRRVISVRRLAGLAESAWWLAQVASLRDVVSMILAGCESELELWGYSNVFDVPGLDDAIRQRVVHVGGQSYRLDMAYEAEMLAVELDGRAFHASPAQWERDIRRDLALATAGWQTIRFSHARLTSDVAGCRRDVLAVRSARRQRRAS